jgi:thioredoxin-like negative regulator of GroEL
MSMVMTAASITMNTDAHIVLQNTVVEINDASFAERIGRSPTPVLLAFCVADCAVCHRLMAVLTTAAPRCGGRVTIAKADLDECPELAARFGIVSVPAVLLLKGGTVGYQFIGDLSQRELDELLARAATNQIPVAPYH